MDRNIKLACYLDEAGEDPATAALTLSQNNISYVVLRYGWASKNICDSTACEKIKAILDKHQLTTIAIISDLGNVPSHELMSIPQPKINNVFNIASYFGAAFVRVHTGNKSQVESKQIVKDWMSKITEASVASNTTPLLELSAESYLYEPADVALAMTQFRRWKLLYDPVQLIIKRNINPFVKYWSLLKTFTAAVDARDFKIGKGYKPCGYGDSKISDIIKDAANSNGNKWFFLEPSLGRRYGSALSRPDTFKIALESFYAISDMG